MFSADQIPKMMTTDALPIHMQQSPKNAPRYVDFTNFLARDIDTISSSRIP